MPKRSLLRGTLAFTLVELLVVIGIITMLIAILLPALSKVRARMMELKCAANLHAIGQGMVMYVQDYGYYPGYEALGGAVVWPIRIRNELGGNQGVFYCPAQDPRCQWNDTVRPGSGRAGAEEARYGYRLGEPVLAEGFFSYGYNSYGQAGESWAGLGDRVKSGVPGWDRNNGEMRAKFVRHPTEMIAIVDSIADGHIDLLISPDSEDDNGLMHPGRIHRGGANVLFCDGHVQWYPQEYLSDPKDPISEGDRRRLERMWNNDGGNGASAIPF